MFFSDQNSFSLEIQWYKFYCWPKSSELIGSNKTFTVHDLPSFVVIKEHVVQTQMVLFSDIFNHHKNLTSSEIGDGTLPDIVSFSYGTKSPSSSLIFKDVLLKVGMSEMRRLFCQIFSKASQKVLYSTIFGTLKLNVWNLIFKSSQF